MKDKYQNTMYACFVGYIVQAIVNNFVPLLFLTFESSYGIPLSQITMLITFNFGIQLLVDLLSAKFVDKIGYRVSIIFLLRLVWQDWWYCRIFCQMPLPGF